MKMTNYIYVHKNHILFSKDNGFPKWNIIDVYYAHNYRTVRTNKHVYYWMYGNKSVKHLGIDYDGLATASLCQYQSNFYP